MMNLFAVSLPYSPKANNTFFFFILKWKQSGSALQIFKVIFKTVNKNGNLNDKKKHNSLKL